MSEPTRKLAAIVFTDIVGFTKLSAENEPAALALLEKQRELLKPIVEKHGGSWLKEIGDGLLLSFNTSRDAVDCSIAIQEATKKVDDLNLRIAIHQGEVVFQGNDVVGDDVNIAARIEPFAAAGGIAISGRVNTSLERDPEFETMFIGTPALKGVSQKTEVYCITSHDLPKTDISKVSAKLEPEGFQWNVFSLTGAVLTVIGVLFWINVSFLGIGIADTPDVPSIAILPFENKGSPGDDFYTYGISSDLITDVTSAGLIRVASLSDVEKLDYKNINNSELAKTLYVRYVAKGTLWKMDSIFQLSMEIFDTKSSKVVYNKRWQTNWKDLATIKDDLSDNILETLEIEVLRDVEDQIVESNPEAYEYYLKGKYKFEKRVSIEDLEIARGFFQKAIELDSSLLKAMIALAKTYQFTNEYDRSIEIYNKALKRSEELNNKVQKAYALNGLGTSYYYRDGDVDKALEYYEKGSELAKETGDKTLNTFFLNNIAIIHNRRGDSEKALEMMEELLTIVEALDDKTGQALALNNIGAIYDAKGEKDRSNDYMKRSLSLSREIGDKGMEGFTLTNIGNYHAVKKQYDLAIKLFNESLEIYKKLGDKEKQIFLLTRIGDVETQSGKHETGFETLNRALELSIEIDNKISIIVSNTAISHYYKKLENYREALNYLFVANKKIKELNAPDRLAYNLYEIGDVYRFRGDVDSAIEYHKRSKDIQEELGNMHAVAYLFLELGSCYLIKGDTGPALDFIDKSISLSKEINDSDLSGWGQFWAGFVYYQEKDYETAVDKYMDKAIVLSKEKEDNFGLFRTAIYFLCLKELNREYDLSEFHKLIEEEEDIVWSSNYYIYKLLGEHSYIKDAYDKVIKLHSNLEPEVAEKFIDYPLVKAVIEEWKMNI